jgi:4-amino-4-deoxy-L-arabinose transferase-like glycosyltransferase
VSQVTNVISRLLNQANNLTAAQKILFIVGLSLTVKLGYIAILGGGLDKFPVEGSDGYFYDHVAKIILQYHIFGVGPEQPTTEMPPGAPTFLALLYAVSNNSIVVAKLAYVALLSIAAVVVYLIGREVTDATIGFWTGVLLAIDPAYAYLSGTFLSEPLFIFSMVWGMYFLIKYSRQGSPWWLIGAGLCWGLAGLTRNEGWLFAVALWIGAMITLGRLIPIRVATLLLLIVSATIAPWTIRNYLLTGDLIPVSSEGGLTLWSSNNPEFVFRQPMPMSLPIYQVPPGLSSSEIDWYYRQRAIEWTMAHPLDFAINGLRKLIALYSFDPLSVRPEVAWLFRLAGLVPYGILIPFIFLGLVTNLGAPKIRILLWYILFTTLLAIAFFGDSRIRAPIQPYLYLLGVLGVQFFACRLSARKRQPATPVSETV